MVIPVALTEALGHMQRPLACPEEVRAKITALRVPADEVSGTRFTTNWRMAPPAHANDGGGGGSNRLFNRNGGGNVTNNYSGTTGRGSRNNGGGRFHHNGGSNNQMNVTTYRGKDSGSNNNSGNRWPPRRPIQDAPRFGNKARKDATTEERMMDRIRDKMNKFSELTYEPTKTWLSQLLDSGETDFLDGFIALLFEKAAAEPPFCALYARLINELRAAFPHLNKELLRIFAEFMNVFEDAAVEPDVTSVEYDAYVKIRERRRFRCGYAAFVGEVTHLGILTVDDLVTTINKLLEELTATCALNDKGQLCEEYAECLRTLMLNCETELRAHPFLTPITDRVRAVRGPSLTNKSRFALMDITDVF